MELSDAIHCQIPFILWNWYCQWWRFGTFLQNVARLTAVRHRWSQCSKTDWDTFSFVCLWMHGHIFFLNIIFMSIQFQSISLKMIKNLTKAICHVVSWPPQTWMFENCVLDKAFVLCLALRAFYACMTLSRRNLVSMVIRGMTLPFFFFFFFFFFCFWNILIEGSVTKGFFHH